MPARPLACALAAAVGLAGAGCGASDQTKVRDALKSLQSATARKDYPALCHKVLAKELINRLNAVGLPCEVALQRALGSVVNPRLRVRTVKIHGKTALALVTTSAARQAASTDTIRLVKESRGWRVASLSGPQPPAPSRTP